MPAAAAAAPAAAAEAAGCGWQPASGCVACIVLPVAGPFVRRLSVGRYRCWNVGVEWHACADVCMC